ncbi:antibiotic biosynthesis monooxygenase [Cryobacterium sp. LW097]|uniref:antibiotic biosynthesis monooxygenase family protein n=1 Tax=unclassified Cryobacterium TaxID=2649013 RepID=UPI000B4C23EF|nr:MULTISPECIES: antibiotic biosynthesis monooxygenase [unclassified Cryobacterium]ASD22267.1 antibiotic biosynthesis monooxygenase [Cryobacterium sp. LW097]TFC55576.1 antibiotic biosynthesis monooxygenase [Cryobacterium sp. TMB3-1-2]TFC57240.1 antibiotic biosynthesis monooxygenase [Cryobacterium sp. TMB1-7]TFC72868.1 antibiotic biosynthesis monooxygenase [Cryobacterium sp. TMB3-15]TFC76374.1 antibiotic biosynthesis monooxygenase [Cryobacterium sp. TMB3-10]
MIREHAILPVRPGREDAFLAAFQTARPLIESMPGFRGLSLSRSVEDPSTFLLLVDWERLEDHTEGFRGSPEYADWRALLHSFYDPFPEVQHFISVP